MYRPRADEFRKLSHEGNVIPVYREILADEETPLTALAKVRRRPYIFLLESVEGGEKWGRYTFLGSDPRMVVRVTRNHVEITENGGTRVIPHDRDPLSTLRSILGRFKTAGARGLPRFFGGAVGFFSYEMVRYMEKKISGGPDDMAETDDALFFITDTLLVFDNVRHTVKVVACAVTEGVESDLMALYEETVQKIDRIVDLLRRPVVKSECRHTREHVEEPGVSFQSNMAEETFKDIVRQAKEYISAGDIIQVVLSQRFRAESSLDSIDLYRALRFINPSPYLFYMKADDLCLIGSSPEALVRVEEGVAELRPIAGTRQRGKTEQEDHQRADELLQDPKEKAEHVMLVDLGRNDLGRIATIGSVQVTQLMAIERYSHVMHLVSTIRAQVASEKDCFDVIRAVFPAGTLSGAPKVRAMEIIEELEPEPRGPYGGAVGYFSFTGNMDFGITIRTMLVKGGTISIQAGAGIVADSDPDREYHETLSKAEGLMKAVRMAALGLEIMEDERVEQ